MLKEIQAQNSAPPASYQTQAFLGVQAAFDSNLESHQWLHRHRRCRWNLWLGFPLACHVDWIWRKKPKMTSVQTEFPWSENHFAEGFWLINLTKTVVAKPHDPSIFTAFISSTVYPTRFLHRSLVWRALRHLVCGRFSLRLSRVLTQPANSEAVHQTQKTALFTKSFVTQVCGQQVLLVKWTWLKKTYNNFQDLLSKQNTVATLSRAILVHLVLQLVWALSQKVKSRVCHMSKNQCFTGFTHHLCSLKISHNRCQCPLIPYPGEATLDR